MIKKGIRDIAHCSTIVALWLNFLLEAANYRPRALGCRSGDTPRLRRGGLPPHKRGSGGHYSSHGGGRGKDWPRHAPPSTPAQRDVILSLHRHRTVDGGFEVLDMRVTSNIVAHFHQNGRFGEFSKDFIKMRDYIARLLPPAPAARPHRHPRRSRRHRKQVPPKRRGQQAPCMAPWGSHPTLTIEIPTPA